MSIEELKKLFRGHEREVYLTHNKVLILHEDISLIAQEYCSAIELIGVEIAYLWEQIGNMIYQMFNI